MAASLQLFLTGGAGNTNPNASLGGVRSNTQLSSSPMNNLFDDVQPDEAIAGSVEYRAIDIYNAGDASAAAVKAYVDPDTASEDTTLDLGLDSTTQSIDDETIAPIGVSFEHYSPESKLSISNIAASGAQRLWLRRTVTAGATNISNDYCILKVEFA